MVGVGRGVGSEEGGVDERAAGGPWRVGDVVCGMSKRRMEGLMIAAVWAEG